MKDSEFGVKILNNYISRVIQRFKNLFQFKYVHVYREIKVNILVFKILSLIFSVILILKFKVTLHEING